MKTYFISDLHLSPEYPEITEKFQILLSSLPGQCTALYILGDLFGVWIGDDAATEFHGQIAQKLKAAGKHFPIYFMPGNRDFLLGKQFCKRCGMQYLKDPGIISLGTEATLLLHGDSLCKKDKIYQIYRGIVRSSAFMGIFLKLPLSWRQAIAAKMRRNSRTRNQKISMELMDISSTALFGLMKKYRVDQAIYGHTHRPSIVLADPAKQLKQIFVLSDWHRQGNALTVTETRIKNLIYF